MGNPFLSEIRITSFNFAPKGWALCDGQLMPINQNQALFSLLGTTYGGDGTTNFALPDLRGKVPFHFGNGFSLGQTGGETSHTLSSQEMAAHNHLPIASSANATLASPGGNFWANGAASAYGPTADVDMSAQTLLEVLGGNQPHENMSPYLVLNFIIALVGIFPSHN